jgi:hypothetical protein
MNLRNLFIFILIFFFTSTLIAQQTEIVYLSGTDAANTRDWDFFCTDGRNSGKWTTIPVPSNWEFQGFGTYNYGHDWRDENKKLGKEHGLYKHEFDVPCTWKGKTVNIVFDGSMTDTHVKVNGKSAGEIHQGAFYRFKYDISKLLKYGQTNLLEVEVAKHSSNESVNHAERQADFWIFGGIFRPVFLEVLPEIHLSRTAIDARAEGSFSALITLNESKSTYTVSIEVFDLKGKKIAGQVQDEIHNGITEKMVSGKFENIQSWNPERPQLYNMKISLKIGDKLQHEVTERIGFRTVELRKHDGFYVNDEKVVFKGVNRHSFWPETGRALSEETHLTDIRLMKEMNMNAVRSSHYVPDKRFLELCDSLGLFVLNEVSGWQDGYDTIVGPKLIKETILKDENHPSVIIWNHGNEGGWDFASEKAFYKYDIQKRPVLYPYLLRNGIDTYHYPPLNYGIGRFINGNDPFMPTELLHGLFDGGNGAGLETYWQNYENSPLHAGGFLWVFADEAVLRTDIDGTFYDADGDHAPDGILGPYREKEGSFYTVKEIWSPVQVKPVIINRKWNGRMFLENKFIYTNLVDCSFNWKAIKTEIGSTKEKVIGNGILKSPEARPGETAMVEIDCKNALQTADVFKFTAVDHRGSELYTWSWPVLQPWEKAAELSVTANLTKHEVKIQENENTVAASVNGLEILFSKSNGTLLSIKNRKGKVSLHGGPVPAGAVSKITGTEWIKDAEGNFIFKILTDNYPEKIIWKFHGNGLLELKASPMRGEVKNVDFIGLSFNHPEEKCNGVKWMGHGPYRVWKNRQKGGNFGVWEKEYNNTVTGETYNSLIYPEFKGYHSNLYWITFETTESDFTVMSETPNLFFQLFEPLKPEHAADNIHPPFPEGNLSFLYEIPAIGTKFKQPESMGPQSDKGYFWGVDGDDGYPIKLWFDFRSE